MSYVACQWVISLDTMTQPQLTFVKPGLATGTVFDSLHICPNLSRSALGACTRRVAAIVKSGFAGSASSVVVADVQEELHIAVVVCGEFVEPALGGDRLAIYAADSIVGLKRGKAVEKVERRIVVPGAGGSV